MNDTYNYEKNIQVVKSVNGDIVLTMNKEIFTSLRNCIYDAAEQRRKEGYGATADDTMKLWAALLDKKNQLEK